MRQSRLKIALVTIPGCAVFLLIAVLGWGGIAPFFEHPALTALVVVFFLLVFAALFTAGNLSAGVREDRSTRWIIAAVGIIGMLCAFLASYTDRLNFWTIDGDTTRWIGVFLFAAGGALRLWPVFVLGNRFSGLVAIQPDHKLVTGGIYKVIRHPSYLGLIINSFGWVLAFRSGVGVLLTLFIIPPIIARIRSEEKLLRDQFGSDYENFCAQTRWRLIPGIY